MIGTTWMREQGLDDALLVELLRRHGLDDVPLWRKGSPERKACMRRWVELAEFRDGPVNPERIRVEDPAAMADEVKRRALELGGADAGITALRPEFIQMGVEIDHENVIAVICYEDYRKVVEGTAAVDHEAMSTYVRCAEISTEIARWIREDLGYPAVAHHNGLTQILAIPVFQAVGFGELGKHGSLIHKDLGSNFRPGIITTDLPMAHDAPVSFGVQDYCMSCNLCTNNCPADAIPTDYVMTDGVKRWLTDIDKCLSVSRLREEYCHICVDVCPYIHKENGDAERRDVYKEYMKDRKAGGYKTPKSKAAR